MNDIIKNKIELLEKQGFEYIYAPNVAPDINKFRRKSHEYR